MHATTLAQAESPARNRTTSYLSALAPLGAVATAALIFAVFVSLYGHDPIKVFTYIFEGGFGSGFAWQDTLSRAAPLILVGLAVAIPAQAGMVVIGGEGALVAGGLAAAIVTLPFAGYPALPMQLLMLVAGVLFGAVWFGLVGALRQWRGLNETISSLLLVYIALAIFHQLVEGVLRDPASLDKPSTHPIDAGYMLPAIPGTYIHIGLLIAVGMAVLAFVFIRFTTWGFALRVVGGSDRVARMIGLKVDRWIIGAAAAGGGMAGLAGAIEVAAVQGTANSSLHVGYGYSGILVAFLSRHHPLAVIPVAILIGGIQASGSLLQRRLGLPDATVLVLQGIIFVCVLVGDAVIRNHKENGRA